MADSTPLLEQIAAGQAQKEVTANGLFDAASPATAYGRHAEECSGLTWAYYGTRYGGDEIANGTHVCEASETTYMMVEIATGAVQFSNEGSDSEPSWDDPDYARCYIIYTDTSSVTSYEDHRFGPLGLFSIGGGASILPIDLTSDVIGVLPIENYATGTPDGSKFLSDDGSWQSIGAGDASATQVDTFSSSGTWTKPAGAKAVLVILCGAGGGGGGGGRRGGGGGGYPPTGGGGAGLIEQWFQASALGSTETVTIGTGGAGGAGTSTEDSSGNAGSAGGNSTFGSHLTAYGGGGGSGAGFAQGGSGGGGGSLGAGGNGGLASPGAAGSLNGAIGVVGTVGSNNGGLIGGASGGSGAANGAGLAGGVAVKGGNGGSAGGGVNSGSGTSPAAGVGFYAGSVGGSAGTSGSTGTAGGNGSATGWLPGGSGGGGGTSTGANGANGGAGGRGSGGGGAGVTTGAFTGGTGGAGGDGFAVVVSLF